VFQINELCLESLDRRNDHVPADLYWSFVRVTAYYFRGDCSDALHINFAFRLDVKRFHESLSFNQHPVLLYVVVDLGQS
jgi:hypothetical protein